MIPEAPAKAGADGIKATKPAAKFHMRWLILVSAAVVLALGMVLLTVVLLLHSAMAFLRRGSGRSSALGLA